MSTPTPDAPRPLRADAERNRAAIIAIATELFTERGLGASLEEVARRAGVGIGTLYRRFPTREDLVLAVLGERMAHFAEISGDAARHARTDPARAFRTYLVYTLDLQARDLAFAEALHEGFRSSPLFPREHAVIRDSVTEIFAQAERVGALRPGVGARDFPLVVRAASRTSGGADTDDDTERLVDILLSGLLH